MFDKLFKKKVPKKSPIERYMEHLDRIFQTEPEFISHKSTVPDLKGVTSIIYRDIPEKGMITALTYGLSLAVHPDWKLGRPELIISVDSDDISWGEVVGYVANKLRGDCPFSYTNTINFREKVSDSSEMDAFLVFAPSTLDRPDFLNIDIGLDYKINIAGLYPIYASEMQLIDQWGLEKFWHHPDFDNYSVNRTRIEG